MPRSALKDITTLITSRPTKLLIRHWPRRCVQHRTPVTVSKTGRESLFSHLLSVRHKGLSHECPSAPRHYATAAGLREAANSTAELTAATTCLLTTMAPSAPLPRTIGSKPPREKKRKRMWRDRADSTSDDAQSPRRFPSPCVPALRPLPQIPPRQRGTGPSSGQTGAPGRVAGTPL